MQKTESNVITNEAWQSPHLSAALEGTLSCQHSQADRKGLLRGREPFPARPVMGIEIATSLRSSR